MDTCRIILRIGGTTGRESTYLSRERLCAFDQSHKTASEVDHQVSISNYDIIRKEEVGGVPAPPLTHNSHVVMDELQRDFQGDWGEDLDYIKHPFKLEKEQESCSDSDIPEEEDQDSLTFPRLIVNPQVFIEQAHLITLKQRILHLRIKYPLVSERTLARVYHRHDVKFRKVSYYYSKKFKMERDLSDKYQVKAKVLAIYLFLNHPLVYVDETSFNLWTPSNYLWRTRNMTFPMQMNRGNSAICIGAVDDTHCLCHYQLFAGSNNTDKFLNFLEGLAGNEDIFGVKQQ